MVYSTNMKLATSIGLLALFPSIIHATGRPEDANSSDSVFYAFGLKTCTFGLSNEKRYAWTTATNDSYEHKKIELPRHWDPLAGRREPQRQTLHNGLEVRNWAEPGTVYIRPFNGNVPASGKGQIEIEQANSLSADGESKQIMMGRFRRLAYDTMLSSDTRVNHAELDQIKDSDFISSIWKKLPEDSKASFSEYIEYVLKNIALLETKDKAIESLSEKVGDLKKDRKQLRDARDRESDDIAKLSNQVFKLQAQIRKNKKNRKGTPTELVVEATSSSYNKYAKGHIGTVDWTEDQPAGKYMVTFNKDNGKSKYRDGAKVAKCNRNNFKIISVTLRDE